MDINSLLLQHGNKTFQVDAEDDLGVFMFVDGYKIHIRQNDVSLAQGLPICEFHPLIDSVKKI
jgi:hypothetical protein